MGVAAPPENAAPSAGKGTPSRLTLAYTCFAAVALTLCSTGLIYRLPEAMREALAPAAVMIAFPVILGCGGTGVVLSVICWREWPLLLMSGVFLSLMVAGVMVEHLNEFIVEMWFIAVIAILIFFCVRWFGFTRRRAAHPSRNFV